MPIINAFRPVVHEKKIFKELSKFPLFCPLNAPPLRGQHLDLNKSESPFPRDISYQIWLKSCKLVVLEKSFKGKVDARQTDDGRALRHAISSLGPLGQVS